MAPFPLSCSRSARTFVPLLDAGYAFVAWPARALLFPYGMSPRFLWNLNRFRRHALRRAGFLVFDRFVNLVDFGDWNHRELRRASVVCAEIQEFLRLANAADQAPSDGSSFHDDLLWIPTRLRYQDPHQDQLAVTLQKRRARVDGMFLGNCAEEEIELIGSYRFRSTARFPPGSLGKSRTSRSCIRPTISWPGTHGHTAYFHSSFTGWASEWQTPQYKRSWILRFRP